jgi:hypothetical protein
LIPVAMKLNYPILVVEGFGATPMSEQAYRLLGSSEKRDVSVFGGDAEHGNPPEIVIPLPSEGVEAQETNTFSAGQTVRVFGQPYHGKIGTLVQVKPGLTVLPNGLRVQAGEVQLNGETRVVVPLANLDVLE